MSKQNVLGGAVVVAVLALGVNSASADVVATNAQVPWPQMVSPAGTSENPTVYLFDHYTHNYTANGPDIGTFYPYIEFHIKNGSVVTATDVTTQIWYLGGDYPLRTPGMYPGHAGLLIDNSTVTTGHMRIGSQNSYNTLTVQNKANLSVQRGINLDMLTGCHDNAVKVTGAGSKLSVTGAHFFVGYGGNEGGSYNESLSVTNGGTLTVGTPAAPLGLYMRYTHDSTITVSGPGSSIYVSGVVKLGVHNTFCYNNQLIVTNGGLMKVDGTLTSAGLTSDPNSITLGSGGTIALKGVYATDVLKPLIDLGDSDRYTFGAGTGSLAGYTVWQAAVPEPTSLGLLTIAGPGLLLRRRRRATSNA